jgi:hypothetical protein
MSLEICKYDQILSLVYILVLASLGNSKKIYLPTFREITNQNNRMIDKPVGPVYCTYIKI